MVYGCLWSSTWYWASSYLFHRTSNQLSTMAAMAHMSYLIEIGQCLPLQKVTLCHLATGCHKSLQGLQWRNRREEWQLRTAKSRGIPRHGIPQLPEAGKSHPWNPAESGWISHFIKLYYIYYIISYYILLYSIILYYINYITLYCIIYIILYYIILYYIILNHIYYIIYIYHIIYIILYIILYTYNIIYI